MKSTNLKKCDPSIKMRNAAFFLVLTVLLSAVVMLVFTGCDSFGKLSDEELSKAEILTALESCFSEEYSNSNTKYIVIKNYSDLCAVYEYANDFKDKYSDDTPFWRVQGNVTEANENNTYPEEYFKNGFIIVALTTTPSGSYTFECSAESGESEVDGEIVVNLRGTLPAASTDDLGAFILLVPVDGEYADESVRIVKTYTQETMPAE